MIIPRDTPRQEQLIRAQALKKQHLIDYIPWDHLNRETLYEKIQLLLEQPQQYRKAMEDFQLDGVECIKNRLQTFRELMR